MDVGLFVLNFGIHHYQQLLTAGSSANVWNAWGHPNNTETAFQKWQKKLKNDVQNKQVHGVLTLSVWGAE